MMIEVSEVLARRLVLLGNEPQSRGTRELRRGDASEAARLLFRKGYRRRVSNERRESIAKKIARAISEDRPLGLVIPFGGYKHFWNPSAPRVDWAEVFHIEFMIEYLTPILSVLPAGIAVEYVSEDFIVPLMDNYDPAALDTYAASFRALTACYEPMLPAGLSVDFWRLSERFDTDAITATILEAMPTRLAAFSELEDTERAIELKRSRRSVNWHGWEDLTGLDEGQREDRIVYARVMEKTFSDLGFLPEYVGGYYEADLRSCAVFSWGTSPDNAIKAFLTLHSAPGSTVDHWIGRGVAIPLPDQRLRLTIVSRRQYEADTWVTGATGVDVLGAELINLRTLDIAERLAQVTV